VDPDDNLYAAGDFTDAGGDADYLALWDGTSWSAVAGGLNSSVYAIGLDAMGRLYAGGNFTDVGGDANSDFIVSWNGTTWSSLGSGTDGVINALAVESYGSLYAGGAFSRTGDKVAYRIGRWIEPNPAGVAIAKSADQAIVQPGDTLTYTLAYSYVGPGVATGVVITDALPAALTGASVTSSGPTITDSLYSPPFVWSVDDLPSGTEGTITIVAEVDPALTGRLELVNTAEIGAAGVEPEPADNSSTVGVAIEPLEAHIVPVSDMIVKARGGKETFRVLIENPTAIAQVTQLWITNSHLDEEGNPSGLFNFATVPYAYTIAAHSTRIINLGFSYLASDPAGVYRLEIFQGQHPAVYTTDSLEMNKQGPDGTATLETTDESGKRLIDEDTGAVWEEMEAEPTAVELTGLVTPRRTAAGIFVAVLVMLTIGAVAAMIVFRDRR
jgi:uncharacterized repeat protein (TIGR01451 family)